MHDFLDKYAEYLDQGYIPTTASRLALEYDGEGGYDDYNGCEVDIWN